MSATHGLLEEKRAPSRALDATVLISVTRRMPEDWVLTDGGGEWLNRYPDHVAGLVRIAHVAHNLRRAIGFG